MFIAVFGCESRQQLILVVEEGVLLCAAEVVLELAFYLLDGGFAEWRVGIVGVGGGEMFGIGADMQCGNGVELRLLRCMGSLRRGG